MKGMLEFAQTTSDVRKEVEGWLKLKVVETF